ncbi:FG-GAP repeat domain-containing protein [Thermogemmatispora onikobensis]|uniref:FG-GAP repeat domain-containing protein n=1 Tax=Thermogemmatispora onikobensis TaxID=732234 RepID=UPI000852A880|nr:VCBS repeat-containing protein [Thermogemmatispora onikobensis]
MPVLEATDRLTPKSALRHRPLQSESGSERAAGATGAGGPVAQRASRPRPTLADVASEEVAEWKRVGGEGDNRAGPKRSLKGPGRTMSGSRAASTGDAATTTGTPAGQRGPVAGPAPAQEGKTTAGRQPRRGWLQAHPLLYLGLGMLCMLLLWCVLLPLVSWGQTTLDDLRYGRPRTFQIDAFVGHNETAGVPSHFIALNLNGHIEIIELPGGDPAHARIYGGPQLYDPDADLVPVTLSFADVNGDHRPDMLVHFQSTRLVFINDGSAFRPLRPDERPAVLQYLERHPNL